MQKKPACIIPICIGAKNKFNQKENREALFSETKKKFEILAILPIPKNLNDKVEFNQNENKEQFENWMNENITNHLDLESKLMLWDKWTKDENFERNLKIINKFYEEGETANIEIEDPKIQQTIDFASSIKLATQKFWDNSIGDKKTKYYQKELNSINTHIKEELALCLIWNTYFSKEAEKVYVIYPFDNVSKNLVNAFSSLLAISNIEQKIFFQDVTFNKKAKKTSPKGFFSKPEKIYSKSLNTSPREDNEDNKDIQEYSQSCPPLGYTIEVIFKVNGPSESKVKEMADSIVEKFGFYQNKISAPIIKNSFKTNNIIEKNNFQKVEIPSSTNNNSKSGF